MTYREALNKAHTALDEATMAPNLEPGTINKLSDMMRDIRILLRVDDDRKRNLPGT